MIYIVSYVILGGKHPGTIQNEERQPAVGERVQLGGEEFEITEVQELVPPREGFCYLHVSCKPVNEQ